MAISYINNFVWNNLCTHRGLHDLCFDFASLFFFFLHFNSVMSYQKLTDMNVWMCKYVFKYLSLLFSFTMPSLFFNNIKSQGSGEQLLELINWLVLFRNHSVLPKCHVQQASSTITHTHIGRNLHFLSNYFIWPCIVWEFNTVYPLLVYDSFG